MQSTQQPIKSALGIQTGDMITTSYNTGPYIVYQIHGPITYFKGVGSIIILDHPEISLTLSTPGARQKGTGGYLNNIRQVGDHYYTAQNSEIYVARTPTHTIEITSLLDTIDPPNKIEVLPTPPLYQFNPNVDYDAGPRRTWHCQPCNIDFNAIPTDDHWCKHNCPSDEVAEQIYYVHAPNPEDRKPYYSYCLMTLNNYQYGPIPDYSSSSPSAISQ